MNDMFNNIPGLNYKQLEKLAELLSFHHKYIQINGDKKTAKEVGKELGHTHQKINALKQQVTEYCKLVPEFSQIVENHAQNLLNSKKKQYVLFSKYITSYGIYITEDYEEDSKDLKEITIKFLNKKDRKILPATIRGIRDKDLLTFSVEDSSIKKFVATLTFWNNSSPLDSTSVEMDPVTFGNYNDAFDKFIKMVVDNFIDKTLAPAIEWKITFSVNLTLSR